MSPLRIALIRFCAVLMSVSGLVAPAFAAGQTAPGAALEAPKALGYRISSADKLNVVVVGEPDLAGPNRRVDANGNINLNYIGEVRVLGLTVAEAQKSVETSYKENRILRNPQVTINIEEYAPREVNITGFVKNPGKIPLQPEVPMTLKDLVLKAGGFQDTANGSKVRISRTGADGVVKVYYKDIDALIRGKETKNTDGSFLLESGDIVYVPEKMI
jgi:polysaccharide export outer membrane protein